MVSKIVDLSSKVVVVTGASMGIGEAIAKIFADRGSRVVLLSRDAGRAEAARGRIGHTDRTLALSCDVRNREEIDRVLSLSLHHFRRIDLWVNNAGHGLQDSVAHMDMAACRDMFDANFFGTVFGMQAVIPVMTYSLAIQCRLQRNQVRDECFRKGSASRVEERWNPRDDSLSRICSNGFQRECHQGSRTEDGTPVGSSRDQRSARRSRGVPRLSEAEAGSHRALDHASSDQDVSTFSRSGGMGDG